MCKKLISVLMPVFNAELYLAESIRSVLEQDYGDIEFIIVDDGSTDGSAEIIHNFAKKDDRIIVIKQENSKIVGALNHGLKYVKGDYVARMDADDICMHHRLSRQLKFMEKNSLDVCGSRVEVFGRDHKSKIKKYPEAHDALITHLAIYGRIIIANPSVLIRAEVLRKHSYDDRFPYAEDFALWLDIAFGSHYKLGNCPETLLKYRRHEKQVTTEHIIMQKQSTKNATAYFLKKHCGLFTDKELEANYILSKSEESTFQNVIDYGNFVEKLITYLVSNKISRKFLDRRLYDVCKRNAFHGSIIGDMFLKYAENPSMRQRAELAIRTMLKKHKRRL